MALGIGVGVGISHSPSGSPGEYVTIPVVLVDADGEVFTDAEGVVLTHGTKRVRLTEDPE